MTRRNNLFSDLGLPEKAFSEELLESIFKPTHRKTYSDFSFVERGDDSIILYINAVGLDKEDITIKSRDGHLIITSDVDNEDLLPLVRNIGHRFKVPDGYDGKSAVAQFKNGILTIKIIELEQKEKETVIDIE